MEEEKRNLMLFFLLSLLILVGYPYFFGPKPEFPTVAIEDINKPISISNVVVKEEENVKVEDIEIKGKRITGHISSRGARFNNIKLVDYKENLDGEEKVSLFGEEPSDKYYAETTWESLDNVTRLPNANTCWKTSGLSISEDNSVILSWDNGAGLLFEKKLSIDDNYLLIVEDRIRNYGDHPVQVRSLARVHKQLEAAHESMAFYEGPICYMDNKCEEVKYDDVSKKKIIEQRGYVEWFGLTEKYWLVAFVQNKSNVTDMLYRCDNNDTYSIEGRGEVLTIAPQTSVTKISQLYLGAKEIKTLDMYEQKLGIRHFDLAIDFGYFYLLTKPLLYALAYVRDLVGNMGLGILLLTLLLKLLLFPLANKSYRSMNKMRVIQPKIAALQKQFADDKVKLGQAVSELYRKENVNPVGGCLPMLLQWPILIALYKVLYISIEIRQAPFFGWIHDLSQADPLSIFNLFGLIPINLPGFLQIGIWPIIMGVTMAIQQKMGPAPADPAQEKMMFALPIIFTFMFAQLPSGLVIYWTFSNILAIIQQYILMRYDRT